MLVSIQLNSNRAATILEFVQNIEETSSNPSDIEVLINIDEGDSACKKAIESLQTQTKVKLSFIQTDIIKSYKDLWKPLNVLLKHTDPNAYFVTNFSDEFRFKTKGWDDVIRKYVNYYEDGIFRIRLSRYRFRNYADFWECIFAPDSLAFYTKKWMDIVGTWCPCLGPDSWQQLVAFYLINSRKFDHIQYNRDIPEPFLEFEGEGASIGLSGLKARRRIKDNVDLWFETVSPKMQEKAKYAAAMLQANIVTYDHTLKITTHNFLSVRKPRVFNDKKSGLISFKNDEGRKKINFFYENKEFYSISYRVSKIRLFFLNNFRKTNYARYAGDGDNSVGKDLISNLNAYFRMRKYGTWTYQTKFLKKPNSFKGNKLLGPIWPIVKIFLLLYSLSYEILLKKVLEKISRLSRTNNKLAIHERNYLALLFEIKSLKKPIEYKQSLMGVIWPFIKLTKSSRLVLKFVSKTLLTLFSSCNNQDQSIIIFFIPNSDYLSRFFSLAHRFDESVKNNFTTTSEIISHQKIYLPIIAPSILSLEREEFIKSDYLAKYYKTPNVTLLFDLSIEAITFDHQTSQVLLNFHNLLKKNKFDPKRIVLLNANQNSAKYYDSWADNYSPEFKINVIGYNFYLFEYYTEVVANDWFRNNYDSNLKNLISIKNKKHFMCLNLRPRWHRKATILFLLSKNFLSKGVVSYFGERFGNQDTKTVDSPDAAEINIKELPNGSKLLEKVSDLEKISPIIFEVNDDKIRKDLWQRKFGEVKFLIPELGLNDRFEEPLSYFEIVTETWLTDERCLYFTEKTIRAILRLNPFIIIGSPHSLRYLKEIGFKTFSPFIDESYDEVDSKEKRMELIFKEIERLCSMSEEEMQNFYRNLAPVLHHNFTHFTNKIPKIFQEEVQNNILQHLQKMNHE